MILVNKKNQGQVALIVLLLSAVIMTLGLSVSRKTVTETKLTTDEELLKKAFSAAESGIEYYLGTGDKKYNSDFDNTKAEITTENIGSTEILGSITEETREKDNAIFWLVGHNTNGSIDYNTSYSGDLNNTYVCVENDYGGEVKIDGFGRNGASDYQVKRWYFDGSGFAGASDSCGSGFKRVVNLSKLSGLLPLLVVVKPITGNTAIILNGTSNFPVQGEVIRSTGYAGEVSVKSVNQKLSIKKTYQVPEFLLEPITSFGSVLSN